nr:hypothetical protein TEA_011388 [Ipomoea batatas]
MVRQCRAREYIPSNCNTCRDSIRHSGNGIVQFIRHTTLFGNKANRSWSVKLAMNNVINGPSSVTNFKSSSLNSSNCSWANNYLVVCFCISNQLLGV